MTSHRFAAHTIFVSIAAYRDSETPRTVADLYAKADHPERIYVGILNQLSLPEDTSFQVAPHPNVREKIIPHDQSLGACWARNKVFAELLGPEEFTLQIDSHMRFDQGWDTRMMEQWHAANDPQAVLTHYPMPYDSKTNMCSQQMFVQFTCHTFDPWGIPKVTSSAVSLVDAPDAPKKTVFLAAGCFFCKSEVVRKVEYDPHIYFNGEEISYAVRLWTHGYNLYLPTHPFLYHDYGVDRGRRLHWSDHPVWQNKHAKAVARLRHLFLIEESFDEEAMIEIEKYCLGTARPLRDWQFEHGIHFRLQLLSQNAVAGEFQ